MNFTRGGWLILLTLLIAFLLTLTRGPLAWPDWLGWLRPAWVVLILSFWAIHFPQRIGLVSAWLGGLFIDIALAEPLGLNGLVLASTVFVIWQIRQRLLMHALLQQSFIVAALVLFGEVLQGLVLEQGDYVLLPAFGPAASSLVLWPLLQVLLTNFARRFRVE